jgi:hypothetical protein
MIAGIKNNMGKCPKCNGSGWVWWYELNEYSGLAKETGQDDNKYTCDLCHGKNDMKLSGQELDKELAFRRLSQKARRDQKLSLHEAAKRRNMSPTELSKWERGEDCCGHKEWKDDADFHFRFVFRVCKKCGMVDDKSMEKVNDANIQRVYNVHKGLKDKSN